MMDPAVKTALALCVLLAGICAATLFRRDPPVAPSAPPVAAPLSIHSGAGGTASSEGQEKPPSVARRPATLVKPLDLEKSPPPLAAQYPGMDRPSNVRRTASTNLLSPAAEPRTHKIVDGDTLAVLAERYLGSAARAQEIFEANRDVLPDPELLPIGAELKIPPIDSRQSRP
jgi:nucleoid-associated protein YgaU